MNKFDAIVFDLDSTLVTVEGLDWLAVYKGKGKEVKKLTKASMEGLSDFNDAMVKKMKVIAPSYRDLQRLGEIYCQNVVMGTRDAIDKLHFLGKEVWILTGNFQPAVGILARKLKIPKERIICNKIFHTKEGKYLGFDKDNLLSHNGGKAVKIKEVAKGKEKRIVYVGDSATDLETKGHVSLFVGFGGVVERSRVKENADVYLAGPGLHKLLEVVLTKDELGKLEVSKQPSIDPPAA